MIVNTLGIDFGTSHIKIYNKNKKTIINERNIIAVENKEKILAVGDEAYEMYERSPEGIEVLYPIRGGVIASIEHTKQVLRKYIGSGIGLFSRTCDYFIAVPSDITALEKRAFHKLITSANIQARKVYIVDRGIADAVGVGVDVHAPRGVLVVNMGADTTELSVISMGNIVLSKLAPIGGNQLNETLQSFLKRNYNLNCGQKTAEELRIGFCCAVPERPDHKKQVAGIDIVSGLPVMCEVSQNALCEALQETLGKVIEQLRILLERTPPELAADMIRDGMYLTGGASQMRRMEDYLTTVTGIPVNRFESPSESVVRGLAKIITDHDYTDLAYEPKEKVYY